jgi:MFS family permease
MSSTQITSNRPSGILAFVIVWIGQLISILATSMSAFALTIWAFEKTGSATALGLNQVFYITPFLIFSPIAGVWIDRYNRKLMMAMSDLGAGVGTLIIFAMQAAGALELWHVYLASAIMGFFGCFQWPAYSATVSLMVPKEQLGRVNGMMSLMEAGPAVVAPLLAGAMLPIIGFTGILAFDIVTFVIAIVALLFVFVPQPPKTEEGQKEQGSVLREAAYGFRYIFARPSLLGLQIVFFFGNLFAGIYWTIIAPMILLRTNNNELIFGSMQSAGAIGAIVGGIAMSAWGGFKRRVHGVLFGHVLSAIGMMLLGLGRDLPVWAFAAFFQSALIPLINGSNQAIWQSKVAPDVQGRVFSARRLIAWMTNPITPIIGGVLGDFVFEPAMRNPNSELSNAFGWLVGTGAGAGMALLAILMGGLVVLVGAGGYLFRSVRDAETILPDIQT